MARETLSRIERLERLQGLLKDGALATSGDLAAELGISRRSLARDVALLRDGGVPIEADRGRGGGVRLGRRWSLGRINLNEEEAIDLLLSMAIAMQLDSPLLLERLANVRQKLAAAFSELQQERIRTLRQRILIGPPASERIASGYRRPKAKDLAAVKEAFFRARLLSIRYTDENRRRTEREIEPQFLFLNVPVWYLLAWDHLRGDVRFFRIDRIGSAAMRDASFRLRDKRLFLEHAEAAARLL